MKFFDNNLPGSQYSQEFHSFQPDESGIQPRYNIWATTLDNLINQGQVKVTLGKHDLAVFATWVVTKIWIHDSLHVFWGWGIYFGIIFMLPYLGDFENPGLLPVQGVLEGTDDCIWWIFEISSVFMFSRSRHPFLIFLLSYHVRVTSKIQVNFRYRRYSNVLIIASGEFLKFLQYLCVRGQQIHFWHSQTDTMFEWPEKSRSTFGFGGS